MCAGVFRYGGLHRWGKSCATSHPGVQILEFRLFYEFQTMTENVHWEVYPLLIDIFIQGPKERHVLFHAFSDIPAIHSRRPVGL